MPPSKAQRRPGRGARKELLLPGKSRRTPTRRGSFLTERQKAILAFISDYGRRYGVAPTQRGICDRFGYSSTGTVAKHLKLLQDRGYLYSDQERGLRPLRPVPGRGEERAVEAPFLGLIAAGRPIETIADSETLGVPRHLFDGCIEDHFVLRVAGDSMIQEGIHDGDFVVVLRSERARPGDMVVALVGGVEATLKRYFPEGDEVRLQPSNSIMPPIRVPAAAVQVQGVVVGLMRNFKEE